MGRPRTYDESEVLESAAQLFWEKGYANTSVQDLVDHLGLKRASIYNLFRDKDDLFIQSLAQYQTMSHALVREVFEEADSVQEGFRNLFLRSLAKRKGQPRGCMMVNCTLEASENKDIAQFLRKNKSAFLKIASAYIKDGISKNQLSASLNVDATALFLFTFYGGLQVQAKMLSSKQKITAAIDIALKVFDG